MEVYVTLKRGLISRQTLRYWPSIGFILPKYVKTWDFAPELRVTYRGKLIKEYL